MTEAQRLQPLDAVRGFAAVTVVLGHAVLTGAPSDGSATRAVAERTEAAVSVFFVLSAYLLYRPFAGARLERRRVAAGTYGVRRCARVVPAYWFALVLVSVAQGTATFFDAPGIVTYFGFAQLYDADTIAGGLPQAWTLCVEVTFYAFLPLWAWVMARVAFERTHHWLRTELLGIAVLVAASVAYKAVAVTARADGPLPARPDPVLSALPAYLDQLALGMALAVLSVWVGAGGRLPGPVARAVRRPTLLWGAAAALFAAASFAPGLRGALDDGLEPAAYAARHALYAALAVGVVLPAVYGVQRAGGSVTRSLAFVGTVSYGAYVYHFGIVVLLDRAGLGDASPTAALLQRFPVVLALSVLAGAISWYALERPVLTRVRSRRRRGAYPAAAVGPRS